MHPQNRSRRNSTKRAWLTAAVVTLSALVASGCSAEAKRGWLPGESGTTANSDRITDLWVGSWALALIIGFMTWGLMLWVIVVYRRRKTDTGFPRQLRYSMPIEMFYTAVPVLIVLTLYFFVARDQAVLEERDPNPDVVVDVVGKQWSWDFNYVNENVYEPGVQAEMELGRGKPAEGVPETLPTLYLPVNQSAEIRLTSRDVIHSFWVPSFLQKKDMVPGVINYLTVTPQREGIYDGKCAELCGEYHSAMLFRVAVVSEEDYQKHIGELRNEGHSGQLGNEYDRNPDGLTDPKLPIDSPNDSTKTSTFSLEGIANTEKGVRL